jgi:hypothetical protein
MSNLVCRKPIYNSQHLGDFLTFIKGLLETIGIECRPISDDMASENRPNGWELKLENHQVINDQNWVVALAESTSPVLNINLQWKSTTLPQNSNYPEYGIPSHATDPLPYQESGMPYRMAQGPSPRPPPGFGGVPVGSLTAPAPGYGGTTYTVEGGYENSLSSSSSSVVVDQHPSSPRNSAPSSLTPESEREEKELAALERQMRKEVNEGTARFRELRAGKVADAGFYQEETAIGMNEEAKAEAFARLEALEQAEEERAARDARDRVNHVEFCETMEKKAAELEKAIQEAKTERELAETTLKAKEEMKESRDFRGSWEQSQEAQLVERALEVAHIASECAAITMEEAEILHHEALNIWQDVKILEEQNSENMKKAPPIMLRASKERLYRFPFQTCWQWHASHLV